MYRGLRVVAARHLNVIQQQQPSVWILSRTFALGTSSASSTPSTAKWSTPSTDPGANRKTSQSEGAEKPSTAHESKLEENKHKKAHQSAAAEKAEKQERYGAASTSSGARGGVNSNRQAGQPPSSSSQSASDVHRSRDDYAYRDQGTGSEENVAADRANKDPLPDDIKHSHKHHHHSTQSGTTGNMTNTSTYSTNAAKKV